MGSIVPLRSRAHPDSLAARLDRSDLEWFARHPERRHRLRRMTSAETLQLQTLHRPGPGAFAVAVCLAVPGVCARRFLRLYGSTIGIEATPEDAAGELFDHRAMIAGTEARA